MSVLLSWPQAFDAGIALVGGKGWNLSRLDRYGFPVPVGGVLPVAAWQRFAAHNRFDTPTAEQVEQGEMPADLAEAIGRALDDLGLAEQPLAVRSSAVAEDGAVASFAGIHDSVLNVSGRAAVLAAVIRCWASAFSERACSYRHRMGLDGDAVAPAVVIQRLLQPVAAGVAFTLDPDTGRQDRVLVAANGGFGETVVNGSVEADQYLVQSGFHALSRSIVERRVGRKQCRSVARDGGGTMMEDVAATGPCLDDATVLKVARLALRVRWALGHDEVDQDVEWVWDGRRVHVVQARPVTSRRRWTYGGLSGQPECWSNGNLRDGLPQVLTPMTWSLTAQPLHHLMPVQFRVAGVPPLDGVARLRLIDGRCYLNASLMQWEYWDTLGVPPVLFNRFLGGHQPAIDVPAVPFRRRIGRLLANLRLGRQLNKVRKRAEQVFADLTRAIDSLGGQDCATMSEAELLSRLHQFSDSRDDRLPVALLLMGSGSTLFLLRPLLEHFLPGRGGAVAHALLAEQALITSAEHGRALAELATIAATDDVDVRHWSSLPADARFRRRMQTFLDRWGHRGVYELELANPRWREDPSWLLDTIVALMAQPPASHGRGSLLAGQTWRQVEEAVPRLLHPLIRRMATQAAREAAQREEAKSLFVRAYEPVRLALLELGDRLAARGCLPERDDIFWLTWEEMEMLSAGDWGAEGAAALVHDRAERADMLARRPAADMVVVENQHHHFQKAEAGRGPVLTGAGAASGCVRGIVRVIQHPEDGLRLGAGEILVAPSTDPAWTPLFLRAAAVVMETGGVLSHGAIVAREYGLPAVVNVRGVLQRLRDGMVVTVDGDNGRVVIEEEEPGHRAPASLSL